MDGGYEGRTTGCGFDCAANLKVRRVSEEARKGATFEHKLGEN